MSNYNEEKKFYLPVDEKESAHNYLTTSNYWYGGYADAWRKVSDRAFRYALYNTINDAWFGNRLSGNTHDALGLALRVFPIDTSRGWVNGSVAFRNLQWNSLLNKYNNALVRVLLTLMIARGRDTFEEMFERGFSADSMCGVIKDALTLVFDAHVPDATTPSEVLVALRHPDRDDIYCGGAHACFSIAGDDTNVCWRSHTQYDDYFCHFFRTALHHALAFFKRYMPRQRYYVSENMQIDEIKIGDLNCCKVELAFGIDVHPADHEESSDDDEESESDHEVKRDIVGSCADCKITDTASVMSSEDDEQITTLTITHAADGTTTTHNPEGFTRITQVVERGRNLTQSEQLGALVQHVIPLLNLSQLEDLAARATSRVNVLRARAAERERAEMRARSRSPRKRRLADITSGFRFSTSFSSGSEGEEGDEDEEEEDE